ncbi:MAG: FAD-dependent oxidoreductase [Acetobacteraceae bacterium]|nr:FAD-dependent oxidoreductase [Acetobacteraceae bacterium]
MTASLTEAMRERLFTPLRVGQTSWRNRIFVPAHTTNYGSQHLPTDRHLEYHRARARGGAAAIIFEGIRVHLNCLGRPQGVGGYDPVVVEPFRRIADAVRAEGAAMLGQVIHLGRQIDGDFERTVSWGPSPIPWAATAAMPHAMERADMDAVIEGHVRTARNLREAGFDGIEVQVAHGHLLQQFLSPASNRREDAYGGSEENRLRFPLQVIQAVRAELGPDYCMGIRFGAEEFIADGLHVDEACRQAVRIASAVQLDFVNVSHSAYHGSYSLATQMADMNFGPTPFRSLPAAVRGALRSAGQETPVFAVCRFTTLPEAACALEAGEADAVGMARAHLADPALVSKWRDGRAHEVRRCIGCNQGCAAMLEKNIPITCLVNPRAGREGMWAEPEACRAATPRDLAVIGGGPAGLEAAWVAAARGHRVRLFERAAELGGQVRALRHMPQRHEFLSLLEFQVQQCGRHQVQVELGREMDGAEIAALAADQVVLATGSRPVAVTLPDGTTALTLEQALAAPNELGAHVAVFDETGEWSAVSVIEHLASVVDRVSVITPLAAFGWRTTIYSSYATRKRLRDRRVKLLLLRRPVSFRDGTLELEDQSTGDIEALEGVDILVGARYGVATDGLRAELNRLGVNSVMVGDCLAPRTALEAVFEGHEAARRL